MPIKRVVALASLIVGLCLAAGLILSSGNALAAVGDISEHPIPTANTNPAGIAAGPDGNLWFTEERANQVARVSITATAADPSSGFVTGGGWVDSPAGAYLADETLASKATFSFVSKYKTGASLPDGATELQFKAGSLNFHIDWGNGVRLYYANLTARFAAGRAEQAFKGFEAVAVSRYDGAYSVAGIADQGNWKPPVLVAGRRSSTTFSDKEAIWVDNAASSPYFGNAYVGRVSFRSIGSPPEPGMFTRSTDEGDTWSAPLQLSQAANNNSVNGRQGVIIRTDSNGTVYVFWEGVDSLRGTQ